MKKLINLSSGWKTYATVALGLAWGAYEWYTGQTGEQMPWYVGVVLAAIGFHRAAISKQAKDTDATITALINFIQGTVSQVEETSTKPLSVGDKIGNITVGKPSPSNQTEGQEKEETAALNAAQVTK